MMLKKMCENRRGAAGMLHTNKGENLIIERRVSANEIEEKTKEYQYFVLNDIFSEYELKNYLNRIKNIIQKNTKYSKEVFDEDFDWENDNDWFHTNGKNFYYFLEEDNNTKEDI